MKKIGIIGLGLIGGSLARALKARCQFEIVATNRSETPLLAAYKEGVIDRYTCAVDETFAGCDIVFVCTPVNKIMGYVEALRQYVSEDCLITDVGSTKATLYHEAAAMGTLRYIGGHPMAGSEKIGYSESKEYLFENAYYIITPLPTVPEAVVSEFSEILKKIGAIPIRIPADKHDFVVAAISHTPHIIASALVNNVKNLETDDHLLQALAAGGFKDITRIASSSPEMWNSICLENKSEILKVLGSFIGVLNEMETMVAKGDGDALFAFFQSAKQFRDSFHSKQSNVYVPSYEILLDVVDRPGCIATIATLLSVNNINIKNIGILNSREYQDGIMQILVENEPDREKSVRLLKEMNFNVYHKE